MTITVTEGTTIVIREIVNPVYRELNSGEKT